MKKVGLGLIVVAVLGLFATLALTGPTDEQLIQEALQQSIQASREGKPGGVLEYLSRSLTYNDAPVGDRSEIAQFIRNSKPDVQVLDPKPRIEGDKAAIVSPVTVSMQLGPFQGEQRLDRVRITFTREMGTRWIVVPAPKWRVSDIVVEGLDAVAPLK